MSYNRFFAAVLTLASVACATQSHAQRAEPAGIQPCDYDQCAIAIRQGFWRTKVVRGATGTPVGDLRHLDKIVATSPEAVKEAKAFSRLANTATALAVPGAVALGSVPIVGFGELISGGDGKLTSALAIGGVGLVAGGALVGAAAGRHLRAAITEYNSQLPSSLRTSQRAASSDSQPAPATIGADSIRKYRAKRKRALLLFLGSSVVTYAAIKNDEGFLPLAGMTGQAFAVVSMRNAGARVDWWEDREAQRAAVTGR